VRHGNTRISIACWYYLCDTDASLVDDPLTDPAVSEWYEKSQAGWAFSQTYTGFSQFGVAGKFPGPILGKGAADETRSATVVGLVNSETGLGRIHDNACEDLRSRGWTVQEIDSWDKKSLSITPTAAGPR
jgi:hypothetical protein